MAEKNKRSISFPRYAEYNCAFKYIVEQALGARYVMPPVLTKRTMELGTKYSPDFVCTPFKTMLGSMIESLEAGAAENIVHIRFRPGNLRSPTLWLSWTGPICGDLPEL